MKKSPKNREKLVKNWEKAKKNDEKIRKIKIYPELNTKRNQIEEEMCQKKTRRKNLKNSKKFQKKTV